MSKYFLASLFILVSFAGCDRATESLSEPAISEASGQSKAVSETAIGGLIVESPVITAHGYIIPALSETAVVYEGARLIVGNGAAAIDNAVFIVDEGYFSLVGTAESVAISKDSTRVDLSGMTVMPAIIDTHVHLSTTREALINDLHQRAYFGTSAALSLGADGEGVPLEIRDESIPGAAVYRSAGVGITSPEPGRRVVHWVTSEEEARQAVRDEAARKVDMIKIWVDDWSGEYEKLSPELYSAVIDEAHKHGIKVAAHIFTLEDAKELLRANIDIFAHGVRDMDIDDEFIALVKARPNVVLIPNMGSRGVATDFDWLSGLIPEDELEVVRLSAADQPATVAEAFGIQARNLDRLNKAGMTIAFGTDGNNPWIAHVEMEDMVVSGMTPAEVLVAATQSAAQLLGLTDMGTIEVGKRADFIVLNANPLDDITNTRKIVSVFLRGTKVDRSAEAGK